MKKLFKDQRGIGAVEIIVIVVLVAVVGFVVWRFIDSQKGYDSQPNTSQTQSPQNKNQGYIVLNDWGIRFKPVDNLKDVTYYKWTDTTDSTVLANNPGAQQYRLSTKAIEALGGSCAPDSKDFNPPVFLTRHTKEISPAPSKAIKVGDHYYYVGGASSACGDAANTQLQIAESRLIRDSLLTIEAAQ